MDTYAGPEACGGLTCNLTKAIALDKAALCSSSSGRLSHSAAGSVDRREAGDCTRYMPGLMMGKPGALAKLSGKSTRNVASDRSAYCDRLLVITAAELNAKMDWLVAQGITSISLWAGAPSEAWWGAMGRFLQAPDPGAIRPAR